MVRATELARHFTEADENERALHWVLAAGDQARALFAHAEAERYFRQASKSAGELRDGAREVDALEKLGDVLEAAARYEEALTMFDRAIFMLDPHRDLDRVRRLTARAGGTCFFLGRTQEGLDRITALVADDADVTPSLGKLYAHLGLAHMYTGNLTAMRRAGERAVRLPGTMATERH